MTEKFETGDRVVDWDGDMATVVRHEHDLPQPNLWVRYDEPLFNQGGSPFWSDIGFFNLVIPGNFAPGRNGCTCECHRSQEPVIHFIDCCPSDEEIVERRRRRGFV